MAVVTPEINGIYSVFYVIGQIYAEIQTKPVRSTKQEYTFLKFNDYIFANINCIMRLILPTKINDE